VTCMNVAHPMCIEERLVFSRHVSVESAEDLRRKYVCGSWKRGEL